MMTRRRRERTKENRTALFRRQPSSLETRSQKDARSWSEPSARAEEAERRRAAGDAELERALAASKVAAAAERHVGRRPASPEGRHELGGRGN